MQETMSARKKFTGTGKPPGTTRRAAVRPAVRKRVLLVDDHPMLRAGLVELVNKQPDMEVSCDAASAAEGLGEIQRCRPELMVTDITLPGRSGVEFIKDALALEPHLPILVLSMHNETIYAERVLQAGARGYIMKEASPEELLTAIRRVLAGGIYVSAEMSARLLAGLAASRPRSSSSPIKKLSDREFEVFRLLGQGLATATIGKRLNLSAKTVATHRINIKAKLGIATAAALISCAAQWVTADGPDHE